MGSRQILIMSRVFAVFFLCYCIQTISAQDADDDSSGNLLNKAGKIFNQHKSQLFSLIGLEEGKEEEFLTKTLEKMNIDSSSITKLTSPSLTRTPSRASWRLSKTPRSCQHFCSSRPAWIRIPSMTLSSKSNNISQAMAQPISSLPSRVSWVFSSSIFSNKLPNYLS